MVSIEAKQLVKRFIARAISPFLGNKKLSVILNYHSVHPAQGFATKPDDFTQQMDYLTSHFTVISLNDFYNMRTIKVNLPDRLAMVTFDDGYMDNHEYAFPMLKKFGVKATIFVTTGFIDGTLDIASRDRAYSGIRPLTWEQIAEMQEWGISFGAHTHTHPILSRISLEKAKDEIIRSKGILENRLKLPVEAFAYPLGQPKTFNKDIVSLLKNHGFKLACSTIWGHDNSNTDFFALHRIRVDSCDTFNDFKEKLTGGWDFIRWIQMMRG